MTQQYQPNVGELCHDGAVRDAIHMAVAPVVAGNYRLEPGEHVGLSPGGKAEPRDVLGEGGLLVGVVDPFLREDVLPGERFWLFLYKDSITGLRHCWQHPAFKAMPPVGKAGVNDNNS